MSVNNKYRWEILSKQKNKRTKELKNIEDVVNVLLENRGITAKKDQREFFDPLGPGDISLTGVGLDDNELNKAILRIKKAIERKETTVVYGDYDADGVCATAILWECLYSFSKNVRPYIPDRFTEGYGANPESIKKLKKKYPDLKLLITVDNGIVAHDAVQTAKKMGIDMIVTDHHEKGKKLSGAAAVVHTTKIGGAGVAWILAREIIKNVKCKMSNVKYSGGIDLCAIGTIADQIPLIGPNRSFAKYGLDALKRTKRVGLKELYKESGIDPKERIGTYEINYIIAPRINAMGRMDHAIDSLRLLCTKNKSKAARLAAHLGRTNRERQRVVEDVVVHAKSYAEKRRWKGAIVMADEKYHEGVIGLAASKLVEEYYRPAIVLSKGREVSKASARSISGFNMIENIRMVEHLTEGGGGHPMAAGFTIKTDKITEFIKEFDKKAVPLLTEELLTKRIKIDMELATEQLSEELALVLEEFEPVGVGNPKPVFLVTGIEILDARTVGRNADHLKLIFTKDGKTIDAIAFGMGELLVKLTPGIIVDAVFNLEMNRWNGRESLQMKIKDMRIKDLQQ